MANRYLSNLRSNASDGYYDTVATMIAADSQTRSAAIQGRYNALSNSITVMADSVVKGMTAAANYQLEQEKLITERRKAESSIARDQALIQIDEQRAETERVKVGMELDRVRRANRDLELERAVTPLTAEMIKNGAGLIAEASREETFEGSKAKSDAMFKSFEDLTTTWENGDPARGIAPTPGARAAAYRNPAVIQLFSSMQTVVNTKGSLSYKDAETGETVTARQADKILAADSQAPYSVRLRTASIVATSPDASPEAVKTAQKVISDMERVSTDTEQIQAAIITRWRMTDRATYNKYMELVPTRGPMEAFVEVQARRRDQEATRKQVLLDSGYTQLADKAATTVTGGAAEATPAGAGAAPGSAGAGSALSAGAGDSPVARSKVQADSAWNDAGRFDQKGIQKTLLRGYADGVARENPVAGPVFQAAVRTHMALGSERGALLEGTSFDPATIKAGVRNEVETSASAALNGNSTANITRYDAIIKGDAKRGQEPGARAVRSVLMKIASDNTKKPDVPQTSQKVIDGMVSQFETDKTRLLPKDFDEATMIPLDRLGAAGVEISKYRLLKADEGGKADIGKYKTVLGYVFEIKRNNPTMSVTDILKELRSQNIIGLYTAGGTPPPQGLNIVGDRGAPVKQAPAGAETEGTSLTRAP